MQLLISHVGSCADVGACPVGQYLQQRSQMTLGGQCAGENGRAEASCILSRTIAIAPAPLQVKSYQG